MSWLMNAWRLASGRQRLTIALAALVTVGALSFVRLSPGSGLASASSNPIAATPTPTDTLQSAIGATQSAFLPLSPTPTSMETAAAEPTPIPVATRAPTPKPAPVPTPKPGFVLAFSSLPSPVSRGSYATATVSTNPGAYCTIVVQYKSGPSKAAGLGPLYADANGVASWAWKFGTNTTFGSWPVTVTCSSEGLKTSVTKYLQVA